jgi:hypothetical protein
VERLGHALAGDVALEHVEALLLLGMNVRAGHVAVGREGQLELEQLAGGVGRGLQEGDLLAADGVVDGDLAWPQGRSAPRLESDGASSASRLACR